MKFFIEQCNLMGKPLIVDQEVIPSTLKGIAPTRKEVADLQNALVEGVDVVMLDKETSLGPDPISAIRSVSQILAESERIVDGKKRYQRIYKKSNLENKDELLAMLIANQVVENQTEPIDLILCLSMQGKMSRILCKYRLPVPLISACPDPHVIKTLNMMNGVHAIKVPDFNSKILGADHLIKILLKTSTEIVKGHPGHQMIVVRSENEGEKNERHYFTFHRIPSE